MVPDEALGQDRGQDKDLDKDLDKEDTAEDKELEVVDEDSQ